MNKSTATVTRLAYLLLLLSLACVLLAVGGGIGHRTGMLHYREALMTLRWSATFALPLTIGAVLLLFWGLLVRGAWRAVLVSLLGLLLAGSVLIPATLFQMQARAVPPIHDISTDTVDPPHFVALYATREAAPNSPDYPGEAVARLQREGYPDIQPALRALSVDEAFAQALSAAERMGWEVVAVEVKEGRIEAVATTFFYGFKDDVVIRVREREPGLSVVDVRSASRVGRSDVGANAKRIRRYLAELSP